MRNMWSKFYHLHKHNTFFITTSIFTTSITILPLPTLHLLRLLHHTIPPSPPLHLLHHLLRHPVAPPLVLLSTIRLHIQYLVISPGLSTTWWNLKTQWNNLHQEQKLRRVSYPLPEFNWSSNPSLLLSVLINSSSCLSIGIKIIIQSIWSNLYQHTIKSKLSYNLTNSHVIITCVWRQPLWQGCLWEGW